MGAVSCRLRGEAELEEAAGNIGIADLPAGAFASRAIFCANVVRMRSVTDMAAPFEG